MNEWTCGWFNVSAERQKGEKRCQKSSPDFWFQLRGYLLCCDLSLSCVWLFATPWTVAHQAPLSMGILQARMMEWVAMPSFRESPQPRDQTQVSCTEGRFFTVWAIRGRPRILEWVVFPSSGDLPDLVMLFHSFTSGWPVFPAPLVKEIVFNPLYIIVRPY